MNAEELKKINLETLQTGRPFPEHLLALIPQGVLMYNINLATGEATYTGQDGATCRCDVARRFRLATGKEWKPEAVKDAITRIQNNRMTYQEFLPAIAAAGVSSYLVDIVGGSVTYYGDEPNRYVEPFPEALCQLIENAR